MFPPAEYPVPVGTPLISPYIKWDHSQDWDVPKAEDFPSGSKGSASASVYNIGMFVAVVLVFPALVLRGEKIAASRCTRRDSGLGIRKILSEREVMYWSRLPERRCWSHNLGGGFKKYGNGALKDLN